MGLASGRGAEARGCGAERGGGAGRGALCRCGWAIETQAHSITVAAAITARRTRVASLALCPPFIPLPCPAVS